MLDAAAMPFDSPVRARPSSPASLALATIVGLWLAVMGPAASQAAPIFVTIGQWAEGDGSVDFTFRATISTPATMTAPDGTLFVTSTPTFAGLNYADLSSRFYGTWTIQETTPVPATYHFTLSPVPVHALATIVSPGEGDTVPSTFDVHWTYADGSHPPSPTHARVVLAPVTFEYPFVDPAVRFHVDLQGQASVPMAVRGGAIESLTPYASVVTPTEFGSPAYTVMGSYLSLSVPVNVTVVPEPGGMLLGILGAAGWIAWRRGRGRQS
jgi:hypothetical protein